jgi:hypothetical protein
MKIPIPIPTNIVFAGEITCNIRGTVTFTLAHWTHVGALGPTSLMPPETEAKMPT